MNVRMAIFAMAMKSVRQASANQVRRSIATTATFAPTTPVLMPWVAPTSTTPAHVKPICFSAMETKFAMAQVTAPSILVIPALWTHARPAMKTLMFVEASQAYPAMTEVSAMERIFAMEMVIAYQTVTLVLPENPANLAMK